MNILVLCTFPIKDPKHGGQLRVRHISEYYEKLGHTVQVAGVLGGKHYPSENGFVEFPGNEILTSIYQEPFLMEDYAIGKLFEKEEYYKKLESKISITPEIIHVELPWLFNFANRLSKKYNCKLIYGSENIECTLKMKILKNYYYNENPQIAHDLIWKTEMQVITESDAIYCVSQENYDFIQKHTGKKIFLVPNGVSDWSKEKADLDSVRKITKDHKFCLFCASGHPPNVKGFFDIFSGGFGSLSPKQHMVVAGSCCSSIENHELMKKELTLKEQTLLAGEVSASLLYGLINTSHCIVLPITQGEGTNLKTAEALWSGKYVITTKTAMRGFEKFCTAKGVYVCDDKGDFKRALRFVMNQPPLSLSLEEKEDRREVLWENCLSPISSALEFLKSKD